MCIREYNEGISMQSVVSQAAEHTTSACLNLAPLAGDDRVAAEELLAREQLLAELAVLALQLLELAAVLALHTRTHAR